MKIKDKEVYVCHSGKWVRRQIGKVLKQDSHKITVAFVLEEKEVIATFKRKSPCQIQRGKKLPYAGQVNVDYCMPYFTVLNKKYVDDSMKAEEKIVAKWKKEETC